MPKLSRMDFFINNFVGCYFRGHVKSESFKFNRYGNITLTLEIPEEYKDEVIPLTDALSTPLVFWVEVEAEFREAMKDDDTADTASDDTPGIEA